MVRLLTLGLLSASLVLPSTGQEPQQQVPPLIAKIPDKGDFFGQWLRQDGTYKLALSRAKGGGVTAKYMNPNPINVESALFSQDDDLLVLTIVLRDEGYPGSTYRLHFDPAYRILVGDYLMPQSGQRHQVYFIRERK
jgi:hypothetical protein